MIEHSRDSDGWLLPFACAIAAVALGYALQINHGEYDAHAMIWLAIAVVTAIAGLLYAGDAINRRAAAGTKLLWLALAAGLVVQLACMQLRYPAQFEIRTPGEYDLFRAGLAVATALAGAMLVPGEQRSVWIDRLFFPALLIAHLFLGCWVVHFSWGIRSDVRLFQFDSVAALMHGQNPYTLTFADLYGPNQHYYAPGMVVNGRLPYGYFYPPLSLFCALPGYLLTGDFRYSQALALTAAGALLGYARPGSLPKAAAALLLFTPRIFYMLPIGWIEPFLALMLAATLFCACRLPRLLFLAFGLFLATKQYTVIALVPAWFLLPWPGGRRRRWIGVTLSILVALAVTLPMALWDAKAFYRDVILFQFLQPFRDDALGFFAWLAHASGWNVGGWGLGISAAVLLGTAAATFFAVRCASRTAAGFAAAMAVISLVFFALNKQAFLNYYFFSIAALCGAVATCDLSRSPLSPSPDVPASALEATS